MELARLKRLPEAGEETTFSSARKMSNLPNFGFVLLLFLGSVAGCAPPAAKEAHFLQNGKILLANKDYRRSETEFKNAAQAMPKDAEPHYQLARVYMAQQNVRQASAVLVKATALNPAHAEAQLLLAALMTSSSDKDILGNAEARVRGVLVAEPDNPQALDALATVELRLGKIDDAVKHLEEAISAAGKLGPETPRERRYGEKKLDRWETGSSRHTVSSLRNTGEVYTVGLYARVRRAVIADKMSEREPGPAVRIGARESGG